MMFEKTVTLLLSGEFVCEICYPEAYGFLDNEAHRKDMTAFLARLGRRLSVTGLGGAWFMAYEHIGPEERRAIKDEFSFMKHELRPLVDFFVLAMRALQHEEFFSRGSIIEANRLMGAIDANPSLRADFQSLSSMGKGSVGDGTLRTALERQLKRLRENGYLVLANPEREIYRVTGKIEYLQEVVEFLMSHEGVVEELDDEPENASLF